MDLGIGQWSLSHNNHGRIVTCAMMFRTAVLGVLLGELIKALRMGLGHSNDSSPSSTS